MNKYDDKGLNFTKAFFKTNQEFSFHPNKPLLVLFLLL